MKMELESSPILVSKVINQRHDGNLEEHFEYEIVGTLVEPKLRVHKTSGGNTNGTFSKYLEAGKDYSLELDGEYSDALYFYVPYEETRKLGTSDVVVEISEFDDGVHIVMEIDS